MIKRPVILLCCAVLLLSLTAWAQNPRIRLTEANADCSGIIDLMAGDTVFGPTTAPVGPGRSVEINGERNSLYAFEKEHNTVWYRFRVPADGNLSLDVIPVSVNDDYDFILYKYNGKNFCADVGSQRLKPVRTCISRNNPEEHSRTGLRSGAPDEFIHSGPGASYCNSLPVKKGEVYVLVLDNVYPGGSGHTLKLHFHRPVAAPDEITPLSRPPVARPKVSLVVVDRTTRRPVPATVKILLKGADSGAFTYRADSITMATVDLDFGRPYLVHAEADGCFGDVKEVKTGKNAATHYVTLELQPLVAGGNIVLENILFFGDQARILPESLPSLDMLLRTMNENPHMVIEIEGHVNCPSTMSSCETAQMQQSNQRLSEERAKAVMQYLISKGMAANRLSAVGYGATRQLFPHANSETQMRQNRRVEIRILSNEP